MKTAEKIIASLAGASLLLKLIDDITWAAVATVLSLSLLSVFYMAGSYFLFRQREQWDSTDNTRGLTITSVISGLILSVTIMGLLFSIMHWPGAVNQLAIGVVGCAILGFVSFGNYRQSKRVAFLHICTRLLIFGAAGLLSLLTSIL